jgi:hypothetical protein
MGGEAVFDSEPKSSSFFKDVSLELLNRGIHVAKNTVSYVV